MNTTILTNTNANTFVTNSTETSFKPMICVENLRNGKFVWVDLTKYTTTSEITSFLDKKLLKRGERLIVDVENVPEFLSDTFNIGGVVEYIEKLEQCTDKKAFLEICNYHGVIVDNFDEIYQGKFESENDFAIYAIENGFFEDSISELYENYPFYLDIDAIARDLFLGDYFYLNGYVFCRN